MWYFSHKPALKTALKATPLSSGTIHLAGLQSIPWWAPLGGLLGAGAVVAGLMFVNKVGPGAFAGLTITANLLMSVLIDKFGWFGGEVHALSPGRMAGCALLVVGIVLISKL